MSSSISLGHLFSPLSKDSKRFASPQCKSPPPWHSRCFAPDATEYLTDIAQRWRDDVRAGRPNAFVGFAPDVEIFLIKLTLRSLPDAQLSHRLLRVPTALSIEDSDVTDLIAAGGLALRASPDFQALKRSLGRTPAVTSSKLHRRPSHSHFRLQALNPDPMPSGGSARARWMPRPGICRQARRSSSRGHELRSGCSRSAAGRRD